MVLHTEDSKAGRGARRSVWLQIAMLLAIALSLRLSGLESRTFGHPENFVPGLDVPNWVSQPPPRPTLDAVITTTPKDGHPPLYFILIHPWIQVFGTSLYSIRLPSALLGAASVVLLLLVARRFLLPIPAFLVAACLAVHGHHIYWSQLARMYVPAGFLVLLATWLLLRFHETAKQRYRIGWSLTSLAALWTHVYCWPIILGHILWEVSRALRGEGDLRTLRSMASVVALAIPVAGLAILQSPKSEWSDPLSEYFEFGYLFFSGLPNCEAAGPSAFQLTVRALGIGLAALALYVHFRRESTPQPEHRATPMVSMSSWVLGFSSAVSAAMLVTGALTLFPATSRRRIVVLFLAMVPPLIVVSTLYIERRLAALKNWPFIVSAARIVSHLPANCALLPFIAFGGVSLVKSAFTARGMIIAAPFLLLLSTEGLMQVCTFAARWTPKRHPALHSSLACAALLSVHLLTLSRFQHADSGPRDYAGLAEKLRAELRPDDLVFVSNTYGDPPLFYYLSKEAARFVPRDYRVEAERNPHARIWLIAWDEPEPIKTMSEAVSSRREARRITARNATAILFAPN